MMRFTVLSPTRADLAGGTVDIWPVYCLLGGTRTINVALGIHQKAVFEVEKSNDAVIEVLGNDGKQVRVTGPLTQAQLSAVDGALRFPAAVAGRFLASRDKGATARVRMKLDAEAPRGSGLGGSSALCVSMRRGLSRAFGEKETAGWEWRLLEWVRDCEAEFLGTVTGMQDYCAAIFGGLNSFRFGVGSLGRESFPETTLTELGRRLIVLFSGEMHHSGLSNWEVFKNAFEGKGTVRKGLESISSIAASLEETLRHQKIDWPEVGRLFREEWRTRRDTFQVHTPRLDSIVEFLDSQKILGCKVCGAAQGGSLIALVEPSLKDEVTRACVAHGIQILATDLVSRGSTIQSA